MWKVLSTHQEDIPLI